MLLRTVKIAWQGHLKILRETVPIPAMPPKKVYPELLPKSTNLALYEEAREQEINKQVCMHICGKNAKKEFQRSKSSFQKERWRWRGRNRELENNRRSQRDREKRKNETALERKLRIEKRKASETTRVLQNVPTLNSASPYFDESECHGAYKIRTEIENIRVIRKIHEHIPRDSSTSSNVDTPGTNKSKFKQMVWLDSEVVFDQLEKRLYLYARRPISSFKVNELTVLQGHVVLQLLLCL